MKLFNVSERLRCISWQWVLEHPRRLSSTFNKMVMVVSGRYSKGWSIVALVLARKVHRLYKINGLPFVAQYLSSCQVRLMRFMSCSPPLPKSDELTTWCKCTSSGIPCIIPSSHRKILRRRDAHAQSVARIYLTIFGFHRVYVRQKTNPDLTNITSDFVPKSEDSQVWKDLRRSLRVALPEFLYSQFPCVRELELGLDWRPSWSGGPVSGPIKGMTNVMSLGLDAACYHAHLSRLSRGPIPLPKGRVGRPRPRVPPSLLDLGEYWYHRRIHRVGSTLDSVDPAGFFEFCCGATPEFKPQLRGFDLSMNGRLGRKFEGGGKVRVFTILDSIRQSCLRPIHDWAMSVLRLIPQDGTFHQLVPLKGLLSRVHYQGPMYCYDLTAATDRFPAALQVELLTWAFGPDAASSWIRVIRSRPFSVPWEGRDIQRFVSFTVGQPLGAYSSWPVFALTHHLVIQYCANAPSSGKWFDKYALLGDDLVIADEEVAVRYRDLMSRLGVGISAKKSLISPICAAEFAKRFIIGKDDLSPISFRSVFSMIPQTVGSMVSRLTEFRSVRRSEPYRWLGAGYRILGQCMYPKSTGRRWKRYHLILTSPVGPFPLPHLWWHSFYAPCPVTDPDIAIVRDALLSRTSVDFNPGLGIYEGLTGEDVREVVVLGKWLLTYYRLITPFLLELINSSDLTPWYSRPTMAQSTDRVKRLSLMRYGTMFRCWERVHKVVHRAPLLRLTPN